LRHTCIRNEAAAPAVDTLITSHLSPVDAVATPSCYARNLQASSRRDKWQISLPLGMQGCSDGRAVLLDSDGRGSQRQDR
jgi:hypothetical protein